VLPVFDLQGGAALAASRAASVTGLLSAFGTIVFCVVVAPKAFARMAPEMGAAAQRKLLVLARLSVAASVVGTGLWLVTQAASMADATRLADAFAAVPTVITQTSFGHVVLLQLAALLILAAVLSGRDDARRQRVALGVAGLAVALQSGHSHAFSMVQGPSLLLVCDILHLAAAGAWLGGLLPLLLLLVRSASPEAGATAARWFSPLGQGCIAVLIVSAAIQGWSLVASLPGLIGTAYGWLVLVKLALFAVLFGFAWFNRYHFAPALLGEDPESARRVLVRSIFWQTGFAIAIVVAAVVLSELPPAMHLQALWPFSERLSLSAIQEDADFRREVFLACLALAASVAVLAVALLLRRLRIAALVVVCVTWWFALPHLDLLLVTAYPTSFYHSPTGFAAAGIAEGATLFAQNCVSCHGPNGNGSGPLAKTLSVPPADLTAAHLWMHSDGELFWWIGHGMVTPEGAQVMPGFAAALDDDQLWALIDYIRAHNAGVAQRQTGEWPFPVRAPDFSMRCDGRVLQLSDLRGRFVRLVIGGVPPATAPDNDVMTVVAGLPSGASPGRACVARDETVSRAYAIISGVAPEAMTGIQFLIDGSAWLRAVQKGPASWDDPKALRAEIMMLRAQKLMPSLTAAEPMKMPM